MRKAPAGWVKSSNFCRGTPLDRPRGLYTGSLAPQMTGPGEVRPLSEYLSSNPNQSWVIKKTQNLKKAKSQGMTHIFEKSAFPT